VEFTQITCFNAAEYLEAFEISPDGTQVAISLNRVLYVVPFDLAEISKARNWTHLEAMKGCFTYGKLPHQYPAKEVRWSNDGTKVAVNTMSMGTSGRVDLVSMFDVSKCNSTAPQPMDSFPAGRFPMTNYIKNPIIPSFDWDGDTLFVLNSMFRYEFGYLYEYNIATKHSDPLDPLGTTCCYTAARFSPDGSFLLFTYQDPNAGQNAKTQLYYIPYGTINSGANFTPLALPDDFFSRGNDHLDATLRPANP
jgi:dipeptidyl aminopeptidase/acylaminoacyl peptidase